MKKLAMIGCGGIGRYHLGHFVNFKDIELAGFCDLLIERAEEFVQIAGSGKAYSDFVKMYDEVKPDMVFICIPPSTHGYIEFETIRRGIPFFVEKPVALDMSLANAINDEITKKNLITAVGFQCRYDDINVAAKNFIDSNKIVTVAASRVGGIPEVNWWRIKSLSGGTSSSNRPSTKWTSSATSSANPPASTPSPPADSSPKTNAPDTSPTTSRPPSSPSNPA